MKIQAGKIRDIFLKNIEELTYIKGIGKTKALKLKAISEIIKRVERPIIDEEIQVNSSKELAEIMLPEMRYLKTEELKIVFLNSKNKIKKIVTKTSDLVDKVYIDPKNIIKLAIKFEYSRIALIHNHPSRRYYSKFKRYRTYKRSYKNSDKYLG